MDGNPGMPLMDENPGMPWMILQGSYMLRFIVLKYVAVQGHKYVIYLSRVMKQQPQCSLGANQLKLVWLPKSS